jgi:sugar O-acyltransferase (sialic acid O-acetyltransferase NeuD family)
LKKKNIDVIIIGYGGNSLLIIEEILALGHNIIGYVDKIENRNNPFNIPFLGYEDDLNKKLFYNCQFISTIGNNEIRRNTYEILSKKGFKFFNIIHRDSTLSRNIHIGDGVFISARVVINPFVKIGNGVICNTSSVIEHDSRISDFAHIGPGAIICGNVSVGSSTFIGAGSVVKEGVKIGDNVIVGAGAVVISDIPDKSIVVGVPAKSILNK